MDLILPPLINGKEYVVINESEFRKELLRQIKLIPFHAQRITGPGRSGAIVSAYVSQILDPSGKRWIPYKAHCPRDKNLLIVDTTIDTGRNKQDAMEFYQGKVTNIYWHTFYNDPPLHKFWFEAPYVCNMNWV